MNRLIQTRASEFPRDADLVVGLPRSGLMAATFVSLALNLPLADLDGFLEGRILAAGSTRRRASFDLAAHQFRRVLVIDDSLLSGKSMQEARDKVAAAGLTDRCVFCAIYGTEDKNELADIVLDTVPWPRVFQWNLMNHHVLNRACLDLDGVLCFDPPFGIKRNETQYVDFLKNARPMLVPGRPVAHIVTSRSERYREQTEAWLARHGILYDKLWMRDPVKANFERSPACRAAFKAEVYASTDTRLFIESDEQQAIEIARLSNRPVLSIETQTVTLPDSYLGLLERGRRRTRRLRERVSNERRGLRRFIKRWLRRIFGDDFAVQLRSYWRQLRGLVRS